MYKCYKCLPTNNTGCAIILGPCRNILWKYTFNYILQNQHNRKRICASKLCIFCIHLKLLKRKRKQHLKAYTVVCVLIGVIMKLLIYLVNIKKFSSTFYSSTMFYLLASNKRTCQLGKTLSLLGTNVFSELLGKQ